MEQEFFETRKAKHGQPRYPKKTGVSLQNELGEQLDPQI
jgi:hypothetical protein